MSKALFVPLQLSLGTVICLSTSPLLAQVTTDGTVNTQINQNGNVAEITGGETRGANLFHSFQNFSVPTGNEAFFNNGDSIDNIFSRVTGGNISNIDGLIRANGTANLFLINPAGIVFGEGARLDIGGSFYGSTASSILFEDGEFSAADLANPPLLTVNAPIGLNFRDEPGDIVNRSVAQNLNGETNVTGGAVGLQVSNGETLALIGGNVLLDDGNLTAKGGHVEIGSIFGESEVVISQPDTKFVFDYNEVNSFGNITLQNTSIVDVTAQGSGSINITSGNLSVDNSSFFSGIAENSGSAEAQAGNIKIDIAEAITLNDGDIANEVGIGAVGNAGNIEINTGSLTASNSSQITSFTQGTGNSGDVNINAEGRVSFSGRDETDSFPSAIFVGIEPSGNGSGGNINIQAESLEITDRAQFLSNVEGIGDAGDINIQVANEVNLVNSDLISEVTAPNENGNGGEGGRGNGGDINVTADSILLRDGSSFLADTENIGDAGNIDIQARDRLVIEGEGFSSFTNSTDIVPSQISTTSESNVSGTSGNINISTGELSVNDGFITASTFSMANAGDINIYSSVLKIENNGVIRNRTFSQGNAGNLTIDVQKLSLDTGRIDSSTFGSGEGGDLTITASEIELSGSDGNFPTSIFNKAINGTGNAGDLTITTDKLLIREQSSIDVGNFVRLLPNSPIPPLETGQGAAGTLEINANSIEVDNGIISADNANGLGGELEINANSITLENGASIVAETTADTGTGGVINLSVDDTLQLRGSSFISGRATEGATGGNINIDANFIVAFPDGNNDILANANQGQGGNITINAESLLGIQERTPTNLTNDIDASSQVSGLDGTINITNPDINLIQGVVELPTNIVSPEQTTAQACAANREAAAQNGLNIAGKGGVPPAPDLPLNSLNTISNGAINPVSTIPAPIETAQGKIQLARGVEVTESGEIRLVPYRTNNAGDRIPEIKPNCGKV